MTKKCGGMTDKDADFAVLDEIREPGASLDDAPPLEDTFNWSALDDKFASLSDLPALNDTFNWSAFDDKFACLGDLSTLDAMFPTLDKRRPRRKGRKSSR